MGVIDSLAGLFFVNVRPKSLSPMEHNEKIYLVQILGLDLPPGFMAGLRGNSDSPGFLWAGLLRRGSQLPLGQRYFIRYLPFCCANPDAALLGRFKNQRNIRVKWQPSNWGWLSDTREFRSLADFGILDFSSKVIMVVRIYPARAGVHAGASVWLKEHPSIAHRPCKGMIIVMDFFNTQFPYLFFDKPDVKLGSFNYYL